MHEEMRNSYFQIVSNKIVPIELIHIDGYAVHIVFSAFIFNIK